MKIKISDMRLLLGLVILLICAYFYLISPSKKEVQQKQTAMLHDIVNRDVDKLSIVLHVDNKYSYLMINDKKIIKEFMDTLKNDSNFKYSMTGQYNSEYVITLHSKNNSDLIILSSETFNNSVKSDSVKVTLFEDKNIDIFNLYYKSIMEGEEFFSLFMIYYGYGQYYYENYKLYDIINKYIKGKGTVYNHSTILWVKK